MAVTLQTSVRSGLQYYCGVEQFAAGSEEMNHNALVIASLLHAEGWTYNAIAGLLGNMQSESSMNPRAYYGYSDFSATSFGLVQWDPTSKYQDWADDNGYLPYEDIEYQCERIALELSTGLGGQYSNRDYGDWVEYNITRQEFISSTASPYYLAGVFAWNYERSATVLWGTDAEKEALRQQRGNRANSWYEYITGNAPPEQVQGSSGMSLLQLMLYTRRKVKRIVVR